MSEQKIVLMVEDDTNLLKLNTEILQRNGYIVHGAKTFSGAERLINELSDIDIAVLDVMLPDGDGFELATMLKRGIACPVLMLTSKNTHEEIVEGMNSDADMYMTKPFVITELIARMEGLMKKHKVQVVPPIARGDLKLDVLSMQAFLSGENLMLTPKDFALLLLLLQSENSVVSAELLYEKAWGQTMGEDTTALRSAITRVRKKLAQSEYTITSHRGAGYVFEKR